MTNQHKALQKEYLQELLLRGVKAKKVTSIKSCVIRLLGYLAEYDLRINEIKVRDAVYYQKYLIETGRKDGKSYANRTIRSMMTIAVSFFAFLKRKNLVLSNPFLDVRKVRDEQKLPGNVLTQKQMSILLDELSCFADEHENIKIQKNRYKMHVAAELMYSTGLRISEAAALTLDDIDFERNTVTVKAGKGGKRRTCFLNEYAGNVLKIYINEFLPLIKDRSITRDTMFFVTAEHLGDKMNQILFSTCRKLGLPVICSHGFRHAVGYHFLKAGCDIRYIQNILGHEKLATTEVYTKVDNSDLKDMILKYHPRTFRDVDQSLKVGQYENINA